MKITKLGHCCLLIEIQGKRFLTDPGNYTTAQNEVKDLDYVVISHEHTDHLHIDSVKTIIKNNPRVKIISNGSVGKILEKESIPYIQLAHGQKQEFGGVGIAGHGFEHENIYKEYGLVENTGYLFDNKLFYPGDAFYNPGVPVDLLAFPVGAPWSKVSQSVNYVLDVKPRIAFPVHDGNLIRHGLTTNLPKEMFTKAGIQYVSLELGKEVEM